MCVRSSLHARKRLVLREGDGPIGKRPKEQRARVRTAKQKGNSPFLRAVRLTPRPPCTTSSAIGRSSSRPIAIAALAMAGLSLLGWTLGKSGRHRSIALVAGDAALSLLLVFLVGWIIYGVTVARRRTEDARNVCEERFRRFVEGVHDYAILLLDCEGVVVSWNAGAERVKGYKAEEIVGRSFSLFYPPEDLAAGKPAMQLKMAAEHGQWEDDGWRVRANGTRFWANVLITALKDDAGNLLGFSKLTRDITERKQADEGLRKNEAQLQAIIENLDEGVVVFDLNGALLQSNHAAQELHGYANLNDFADTFELSGTDGKLLASGEWPLARILRGEKLQGLEVSIRRIHADWQRVFNCGGTLVRGADGQPLMAVLTIRDITERKRAADMSRELNDDLEQRVVERTAQLQTANNELEAFCYSVSHDLRTPLRSLDGFSEALLEDYADKLDDQGRNYLGRIRASSQRMGQLIDDLLDLSRVSRGEMTREPVDLSKMAHEVADELRATAPLREAEFVVADGLIAETDPRLLRIVLTNLFGNAWKFTAKQPHARIEFGCSGENGGKEYFLRDNGAGFDEAYSSKLFGVFQRLHTTSDFPGTGIGLATVQRIIHRQGGRIRAEGKVERGATFHFTL